MATLLRITAISCHCRCELTQIFLLVELSGLLCYTLLQRQYLLVGRNRFIILHLEDERKWIKYSARGEQFVGTWNELACIDHIKHWCGKATTTWTKLLGNSKVISLPCTSLQAWLWTNFWQQATNNYRHASFHNIDWGRSWNGTGTTYREKPTWHKLNAKHYSSSSVRTWTALLALLLAQLSTPSRLL